MKKKEKTVEDERRQNFSYVTYPSITVEAKKKAFKEGKTLSSKIEELLIAYNNSK